MKRPPAHFAPAALARAALLSLAMLLVGCASRPALKQPSGAYFGETDPPDILIARLEARNQHLPTLWARLGDFEVWANNPQTGKTDYVNGAGGYLLYRAPAEFRLRGSKPGAGMIFELGLSPQRYWLAAPAPGPDVMWWGTVGAATDPAAEIPIRPELVQHVLALGPLQEGVRPLLRFNNDQDAYMLLFCRQDATGLRVEKEVWYDRATLNAKLVILFDMNGRAVLRAYLSEHRPVSGAAAEAATVATAYDLFFPSTRSRMLIKLESVRLENNGVPSAASFTFPPSEIVGTVRNIDAKHSR
jgi:hypothetical protein